MCLSKVILKSGDKEKEVMQDVAELEYKGNGYLFTGLLGDQKFVKGIIKKIEFINDHVIVLELLNNKQKEDP